MQQKVGMGEWITDMIEDMPDLTDIWFSDEAHFYLSGHVNWKTMSTVEASLPIWSCNSLSTR